jgi:hypothetical protein
MTLPVQAAAFAKIQKVQPPIRQSRRQGSIN